MLEGKHGFVQFDCLLLAQSPVCTSGTAAAILLSVERQFMTAGNYTSVLKVGATYISVSK